MAVGDGLVVFQAQGDRFGQHVLEQAVRFLSLGIELGSSLRDLAFQVMQQLFPAEATQHLVHPAAGL